ncbi:beta-glucuronosyltransferase GlcAT14A isoform X1 [Ricinus communis]|uniref:beta-glucuronosyltransferase GlcAT14A isoform X1 n=1 Tax=Ricinus communis TaxID=3988 RepID=UPI00201A3C9F|nr:beta-glucuronosyltransferase GlcAT14A isoform X1 [Ricinus communis]
MGAEKRWLFTLFSAAFISLLFLLFYSISALSSPKSFPSIVRHGTHYPPAFAYYISGGRGDGDRILRLLLAVYHPRNHYLLHLGADASDEERARLVWAINAVPAIRSFANVDVVGKPSRLVYMGSSNLAATLRAAAILLRVQSGWNWFVALSAFDYPLLTQDGCVSFLPCCRSSQLPNLLHCWQKHCIYFSLIDIMASELIILDLSHVFSSISRDFNFIDHTSDLGWKESQRFQPIVVDPGIYLARRSQIFHATQKRGTPDAFKVFTGSPWVILSRSFLEFCILGWDNLPRTLLMYFNNMILSEEGYFHSVICNAPEFKNTTVNSDLRYMVWDNPPKMEPHFLNISDYDQMVQSGAAFARQFKRNDPILDMVDEKILKRGYNQAAPGAWCTGRRSWWMDPCSQWGDVNVVKPGPQAKRFEDTIRNLLDEWNSQMNQCK